MQKNIALSIIVSGALIAGMIFLFTGNRFTSSDAVVDTVNVEIRDGVQYVTITAHGGYAPRTSTIQPDIPTRLIVKTDGTYDCSASLTIRSIGFQKILAPTGEEVIDLGTAQSGDIIKGLCSMGMYNFTIKAS
ncbi:MAG: hypothetical protein AUK16_00060 [Parcubacteria group bacterium CG2_30_44_11]|nr:MAG: hypothetical protein AUK16_00060 [Parcubacteria group bacterium CG2_30_44_11]